MSSVQQTRLKLTSGISCCQEAGATTDGRLLDAAQTLMTLQQTSGSGLNVHQHFHSVMNSITPAPPTSAAILGPMGPPPPPAAIQHQTIKSPSGLTRYVVLQTKPQTVHAALRTSHPGTMQPPSQPPPSRRGRGAKKMASCVTSPGSGSSGGGIISSGVTNRNGHHMSPSFATAAEGNGGGGPDDAAGAAVGAGGTGGGVGNAGCGGSSRGRGRGRGRGSKSSGSSGALAPSQAVTLPDLASAAATAAAASGGGCEDDDLDMSDLPSDLLSGDEDLAGSCGSGASKKSKTSIVNATFQVGQLTLKNSIFDDLLNARKLELLNDPEIVAILEKRHGSFSQPATAVDGGAGH